MYTLDNVRFKTILTIDHLTIRNNVVTCIIGKSGSGKTTLLRMLNKMISPDFGTIAYLDKPLIDYDSVLLRRNVVMLGQSPVVFPSTVRDNLLMGLQFSERPIPEDAVLRERLRDVHLSLSLDDDANLLSGGELQRISLARIMLMEPDVYLLDEPSSALDEHTEEEILSLLVDYVRKRKKSLIMVTHSSRMAKRFGEDIIELDQGQIESVQRNAKEASHE